MTRPTTNARRQTGFTLVELMVALTLGLLVTAAIVSLFVQTKHSSRQNDNVTQMQENARFALDVLRRDLMQGAFFSAINDPGSAILSTAPAPGQDCGAGTTPWAYVLTGAIDRVQYHQGVASGTDANAAHSCIAAADFKANTNILAVKRVKGAPVTTVAQDGTVVISPDNKVYLRSNGLAGTLYHYSATSSVPAVTGTVVNDWEYLAHVYYVGPDHVLYREFLQPGASTAMTREAIAEGIEYFHVEFGIDDTDPFKADGVANFYTPDPGDDLANAASARIYILARSPFLQPGYSNEKTYVMGSVNVNAELLGGATFSDGIYRRVYTTTVMLKNVRNQLLLGK